jgi:hypothetical protein
MEILTLEKLKQSEKFLTDRANENFYLVVHPSIAYNLKVIQARDRYYLENHIRRWEKKYGTPYPSGESGCFGSVTFLERRPL